MLSLLRRHQLCLRKGRRLEWLVQELQFLGFSVFEGSSQSAVKASGFWSSNLSFDSSDSRTDSWTKFFVSSIAGDICTYTTTLKKKERLVRSYKGYEEGIFRGVELGILMHGTPPRTTAVDSDRQPCRVHTTPSSDPLYRVEARVYVYLLV